MAHILFADANESALHTMRRALELGHRVTFIQGESWVVFTVTDWIRDVLARASRVIKLALTSDPERMTEAIRAVHAEDPVDAVIGQLEPAIEATAIACERLSIPFTSVEGVCTSRNKARARERLVAAGLASARHAVAHDVDSAVRAADSFGYPVVVKPVSGMDSILAYRANDAEEVRSAARAILAAPETVPEQIREQMGRGALIEEHLRGELVSAELALLHGQCYRFLMCGRSRGQHNDCVEMGAALPARLSAEAQEVCFDYAEKVCKAVGLDMGVFHIEMILTERGPVLVEVNPRPMGGIMTTMYRQLTGVDFSDYIIDIYLRRPPSVAVPTPTRTITARKLMPRSDGALAGEIDLGWVDVGGEILAFHNYKIAPGAHVRGHDVLARYVILADTWDETMTRADGLIARFEESLGVPLIHSAPAV